MTVYNGMNWLYININTRIETQNGKANYKKWFWTAIIATTGGRADGVLDKHTQVSTSPKRCDGWKSVQPININDKTPIQ